MIWVLGFLALTVYLFASEIVRVDVAAVLVMVLLGLTTVLPDSIVTPLVDPKHLFDGFASNAVVSIIAVMIIGAGLDKTGLMSKVAGFIMHIGGTTEKRIIPLISGTVGFISSFMQNVGAAALFLPVVSRISNRTGLPMSRLLMPMGFCAILGGTITMIGSSPLILLNDLILTSNKSLTAQGAAPMETFELFAVTPIGLALITAGILYFVFAGRFVLPVNKSEGGEGESTTAYFHNIYGLSGEIFELHVPAESVLAGLTIEQIEARLDSRASTIALFQNGQMVVGPACDNKVEAGAQLALMGPREAINAFVEKFSLELSGSLAVFADVLNHARSGIAEVVIPPNSDMIGKTLSEVRLRQSLGLNVLAIHRAGDTLREGLRNIALQAGDTLILHSTWDNLAAVDKKHQEFVVLTTDYPHEELRPHKVPYALAFFLITLLLILAFDVRLSVALFIGAIGMIVSGVLTMDEAYEAVSWKSVFLLASLIPLGQAVESTGTANWIAVKTLELLGGDVSHLLLQVVIAVLATVFTLVMSNVGATVLLVPLAVNIALQAGANPALFALTVAISTSNSFFLPTHQVNALLMGPGGYRVIDYMRVGGIMTVLFWIVSLTMLNIVF
jgi:di/tricarboxylate transporter